MRDTQGHVDFRLFSSAERLDLGIFTYVFPLIVVAVLAALLWALVVEPYSRGNALGDHLRSGGSIVNVIPEQPREGSAEAAVKAAISDWTAGQATHFGTRGITVNAVASGRNAEPGYDGLSRTPAPVAAEIARLALFLTTPAARHITGQTLHVSHAALATFG